MNFNRLSRFQRLESRRMLAAVSLPRDLTVEPSQQVSVPVEIDNASGVRGAEIRIQYDTTVLDLSPSSVTLGSAWNGSSDAQITTNVDDATGLVVIFISSSSALTSSLGSLADLSFSAVANATAGTTANLDLTSVTLNERGVPVTPSPIAGSDSTDGVVTISTGTGRDDRIAGVVYADGNSDNSASAGEAIPGVTLTLRNSSTNQEQQVVTATDGTYEFDNLAPGTYQLIQQQPAAYLEGGANTLSVTIVDGQSVPAQDFQEGAIRPEFLYNRLLTNLVRPVGSVAWTSQIVQINQDASVVAAAALLNAASGSTASHVESASSVNAASVPAEQAADEALRTENTAEGEGIGIVLPSAQGGPMVDPNPINLPLLPTNESARHEQIDAALASPNLW